MQITKSKFEEKSEEKVEIEVPRLTAEKAALPSKLPQLKDSDVKKTMKTLEKIWGQQPENLFAPTQAVPHRPIIPDIILTNLKKPYIAQPSFPIEKRGIDVINKRYVRKLPEADQLLEPKF